MHTLTSCIEYITKNFISAEIKGQISSETVITGICYDSRKIETDNIFFCKGRNFSTEYLQEAVFKGAACIVCPRKFSFVTKLYNENTVFVLTDKVREVMAHFSAFFYGFPLNKLTSIAVTGTKGKTSTSQMLKDVLNGKNGIRAEILRDLTDGSLTTPESPDLHKAACDALKSGATHLICEISSQAIKDLRVLGITFDIACFLNFSPDHISPAEHSCVEEYFLCKASLFLNCKQAVVNISSDAGKQILGICQKNAIPSLAFSCDHAEADVSAKEIVYSQDGISFTVCDNINKVSEKLFLTAFGSCNAENALCAYSVAKLLNILSRDVFRALATSKTAGRGAIISSLDGKIHIIVDYAHNGLSFEKVLKDAHYLYPGRKLTVIFGCPGNKAYIRRVQLPEVALKYADSIVISEDDSGSESFESISAEMMSNIKNKLSSYPDPQKSLKEASVSLCKSRAKAIENSVLSAYENSSSSVIAILGRGEDKVMKLRNGNIYHKSDLEIAENSLRRVNEKLKLSAVFTKLSNIQDRKILLSLPDNKNMIRSAVSSILPLRDARAAIYCQSRYAPLVRDICYENGRLCHVCDRFSDYFRECTYCFRSGTIPVFLSDASQFPVFYELISLLSFDTAVYISDKKGILIDGKAYVSCLSYENALLLKDRTRTQDIALLTTALEYGAKEALLLNGANSYGLSAYLCGGSICGTVVKKLRNQR